MRSQDDLSRLREIYSYNPDTGEFKRVSGLGPRKTGHKSSEGYMSVNWQGKLISLHRLAWALINGSWPKGDIDHINGERSDNRICNLRDVSRQVNLQNQRVAAKRNVSGYLGVSAQYGKWTARIYTGGKAVCIGTFPSPEIAHEAYLDAKRRLHAGCTI